MSRVRANTVTNFAGTGTPSLPYGIQVGTGATVRGDTNTISALTNGSERLRITSDGKFGIGTIYPTQKLDVRGNVYIGDNIQIDGNTTLGDSSSDTLTVNATSTFAASIDVGGLIVTGVSTISRQPSGYGSPSAPENLIEMYCQYDGGTNRGFKIGTSSQSTGANGNWWHFDAIHPSGRIFFDVEENQILECNNSAVRSYKELQCDDGIDVTGTLNVTGTLDVTGAAGFDSTVIAAGKITANAATGLQSKYVTVARTGDVVESIDNPNNIIELYCQRDGGLTRGLKIGSVSATTGQWGNQWVYDATHPNGAHYFNVEEKMRFAVFKNRSSFYSGTAWDEVASIDDAGAATFAGQVRSEAENVASFVSDKTNDYHFYAADGNTVKFTVDAAGAATFAGSVKIGGTAAANEIDEYEEGTWTVALQDTTGNAISSSGKSGHYTRIGNLVYCVFAIAVSNTNSAGNNLEIHGLPFTCEDVSHGHGEPSFGGISYANNLSSTDLGGGIILRVNNATSYVECKYTAAGAQTSIGGSVWNTSNITSSTYMTGSFQYRT